MLLYNDDMTTNLNNITSNDSISNLIALWQDEADRFNAERTEGEQTWVATAQNVGYGYCSDYFKYEAGNGIRPRWMSEYPVEASAHEYATMYKEVNEAEARREAREAEGKRKVAEAMKPSPAFTIGDVLGV